MDAAKATTSPSAEKVEQVAGSILDEIIQNVCDYWKWLEEPFDGGDAGEWDWLDDSF